MLSVKFDTKKALIELKNYNKAINKASISALNKTAAQAKTGVSGNIRKEYNIKAKDLNKAMTIQKANENKLWASIIALGRGLSMKYYGAKQTKAGVTVKIKKTGNRTLVKGAFGPNIPRLGGNVFKRAGKERTPIKKLYSIGPSAMLNAKKSKEFIKTFVKNNFDRIFKSELKYFTKK